MVQIVSIPKYITWLVGLLGTVSLVLAIQSIYILASKPNDTKIAKRNKISGSLCLVFSVILLGVTVYMWSLRTKISQGDWSMNWIDYYKSTGQW
jgi:hypothetical protein